MNLPVRLVYISFLAREADEEAHILRRALEARQLAVFCDPHRHKDEHRVKRAKAAIQDADLVVILGTEAYGQHFDDSSSKSESFCAGDEASTSTNLFETGAELQYILQANKRVLMVHMCPTLACRRTRYLIAMMSHTTLRWQPKLEVTLGIACAEPPAFLIDAIAESAEECALMCAKEAPGAAEQTLASRSPATATQCQQKQHQQQQHKKNKQQQHQQQQHQQQQPRQVVLEGGARRAISADGETKLAPQEAALSSAYEQGVREPAIHDHGTGHRHRHRHRRRRRACTDPLPGSAVVASAVENDIDARLSAIAVNVDNIQAQASAFGTLVSRMLERGPTLVVSRLLASQSSIDAIFRAMRMHLHNTLLQRCGLYILKHVIAVMAPTCPRDIKLPPCLAFGATHERRPSVDSGASDNSLPRVMEEGAALAVLLMNMHPGDETLQKHGVQIVELVTNHGPEGRAHALELKANAAITSAMQAHKRSSRIQLCGRVALDNIEYHKEQKAPRTVEGS